jgi:hypothetical protein
MPALHDYLSAAAAAVRGRSTNASPDYYHNYATPYVLPLAPYSASSVEDAVSKLVSRC